MLIALLIVWLGCSVGSFAFGWWARGQSIDLNADDAGTLREALDAVEAGEIVRLER